MFEADKYESVARAYCAKLGLDPDSEVLNLYTGQDEGPFEEGTVRHMIPYWKCVAKGLREKAMERLAVDEVVRMIQKEKREDKKVQRCGCGKPLLGIRTCEGEVMQFAPDEKGRGWEHHICSGEESE